VPVRVRVGFLKNSLSLMRVLVMLFVMMKMVVF